MSYLGLVGVFLIIPFLQESAGIDALEKQILEVTRLLEDVSSFPRFHFYIVFTFNVLRISGWFKGEEGGGTGLVESNAAGQT